MPSNPGPVADVEQLPDIKDKAPPRRRAPLRRRALPYAFLAPGTLWLIFLFIVPIGLMASVSLQQGSLESGYRLTWHLRTYVDAASSYGVQLYRSVWYALLATTITLLLAFPLAYAIAFVGGKFKSVLLFLVILPYFVPSLIRILSWQFLLSDHGLVLGPLKSWGILSPGARMLNTAPAVILGLVYTYFPFMTLPIYVSIERIKADVLDAARDLYATRIQTLLHVTLPLTTPGIFAGALLTFIPIAGDPVNSALLGGTHTTMIGNIIQREFLTVTDYPTAAALAFILMAVLLAGALLYAKSVGADRLGEVTVAQGPSSEVRAGRGYWLKGYIVLLMAWLYLPVLIMAVFGFNDLHGRFNVTWQGSTFHWYRDLFQVPGLTSALKTSLLVALIVTLVSTSLGLGLALALSRYRFRGRSFLDALIFLPMATPTVVLGSALLVVFVGARVERGLGTIIVTHVMLTLSFVVITIKARSTGFDPLLEDGARDLGANEWATLRTVTIPLLFPALLAAASVAFALSIDDFVTTSFVAGQTVTLPLWIFGSTRLGVPPQVNVMGTLLLLFGIIAAFASSALHRARLR